MYIYVWVCERIPVLESYQANHYNRALQLLDCSRAADSQETKRKKDFKIRLDFLMSMFCLVNQ